MKSEIAAVVSFLKRLVKLKNKVEVEKMDLFAERLTVALQEKFEGHWVPEKPSKGQAYRCIRVNAFHKYDPELLRACRESGVHYGTKTHNYSSLLEDWTIYVERFEQYCLANDIRDERKVAVLLSLMGAKTYNLLRSLTAPDKPADKTISE
uniref:B-cell translocation gene 3 n=1 Tax=Gouania willdenowi TaxID=441366 RepID=A0A8C5DSV5_GOUWI